MERNIKRKIKSLGSTLKNGSNNSMMGTGIKDRSKSHDFLQIDELHLKCQKKMVMMKKDYLDLIGIIHMNFKSKNLLARMTKMINRINRSITSINPLAKWNNTRNAILVKKM